MNVDSLPVIGRDEAMQNLDKAVERRRYYAAVKKSLRAGVASMADVLSDPDAARIKARDLIRCIPGFGKVKTALAMAELGISENRRVSGLGHNQKERLIEFAEKHGR